MAKTGYFNKTDRKILLLDQAAPAPLSKYVKRGPQGQIAITDMGKELPEHRVFSINPSSKDLLDELGVWSMLHPSRVTPIKYMQVWEAGGTGYLRWGDNMPDPLGYIVENGHLQSAVHEKLEEQGIVIKKIPAKIKELTIEQGNFAKLSLEDNTALTARLVVGCEGANSFVKKTLKIPSWGWSVNQIGIVCSVETNQKSETAWQRFLETGPIALLPCWEKYSSIVWSCDRDFHKFLLELDEEKFVNELNFHLTKKSKYDTINLATGNAASFDLPPVVVRAANKRVGFPLNMAQAERYIGNRAALVGDAAHSVHPLAGQGLNLGLMDAETLTHVIDKNLKAGHDIGDEDILQEYENKAKLYNYLMMGGMEFIKRSYENDFFLFAQARNLAISAINNLGITNYFNDVASGKFFREMLLKDNSSGDQLLKGMKKLEEVAKSFQFPKF